MTADNTTIHIHRTVKVTMRESHWKEDNRTHTYIDFLDDTGNTTSIFAFDVRKDDLLQAAQRGVAVDWDDDEVYSI
jgi:hypothetical protein